MKSWFLGADGLTIGKCICPITQRGLAMDINHVLWLYICKPSNSRIRALTNMLQEELLIFVNYEPENYEHTARTFFSQVFGSSLGKL